MPDGRFNHYPASSFSIPIKAVEAIAQCIPNLDQLGKEAYVEGFQIAMGVLAEAKVIKLSRLHRFLNLA